MKNTQTFQLIPLKDIILSGDNQRQIDEKSESFEDLKASIAGGGVRVPIQVRPHSEKKGKFELRAGERRYRACKSLGLESIPAVVYSDMDSPEALDLTYIENKFRQDLKPMEEAAELSLLMERFGGDVKAIAHKIGKKEQWVRIRANIICGLSKTWKAIFGNLEKHKQFESWSISHLIQVARLPEHLQVQLYKEMTTQCSRPERLTAKDIEEKVSKIMHLLRKAQWNVDDETLLPKAGACSNCPNRTGHQPLLWFDSEDQAKSGDQCLDPLCWQEKIVLWLARQAKNLKEQYPKLILVAKDYPSDMDAKSIQKTVGQYIQDWECKSASKGTKGALPAMYVNGKGAGKLTYVKLFTESAKTKVGAPKTGTTPLKERRKLLDAKRWAQVLLDLKEMVGEIKIEEIKFSDKVTGLMALVALYGNEIPWDARYDVNYNAAEKLIKSGQQKTLETLWETFKPTLGKLLTYNGPITQTPQKYIDEATWIAKLIGQDAKKLFKSVSERKGFTEPKSWKSLNADGTPKSAKKPKPSKKTKAKSATGRHRAENEAAKNRTCRICGCTDDNACIEDDGQPCQWVEDDLCSKCEPMATKKKNKKTGKGKDAA